MLLRVGHEVVGRLLARDLDERLQHAEQLPARVLQVQHARQRGELQLERGAPLFDLSEQRRERRRLLGTQPLRLLGAVHRRRLAQLGPAGGGGRPCREAI